jgi:hypothetical protein
MKSACSEHAQRMCNGHCTMHTYTKRMGSAFTLKMCFYANAYFSVYILNICKHIYYKSCGFSLLRTQASGHLIKAEVVVWTPNEGSTPVRIILVRTRIRKLKLGKNSKTASNLFPNFHVHSTFKAS